MIEKTNLPIKNKDTNKIKYRLNLDRGIWTKSEFDSRGNEIYYESITGFWCKYEYDSRCNRIYFENSYGIIRDDR